MFIDLKDYIGEPLQAPRVREAIAIRQCPWRYEVRVDELQKIRGTPFAYWLSSSAFEIFDRGGSTWPEILGQVWGNEGDDEFFLRDWYEVNFARIGFGYEQEAYIRDEHIFFPMNKEEGYRKWSGRFTTVFRYVIMEREHSERTDINYRLRDKALYFKSGISWETSPAGLSLLDASQEDSSLRHEPQQYFLTTA